MSPGFLRLMIVYAVLFVVFWGVAFMASMSLFMLYLANIETVFALLDTAEASQWMYDIYLPGGLTVCAFIGFAVTRITTRTADRVIERLGWSKPKAHLGGSNAGQSI